MNIRNALHLSTVAVVLAGGCSLHAQVTTGALNGSVTDEMGNPIAGARVVLESPALFQPRVYSTNDKGEYRALLLPVGNYVVKVSASGKLSKTANDVRVGVGTNLSMPFVLKAQKPTESATVEVVSDMAAESKTNDKVSVNYSAEQLMQMPVSLDFNNAIQLAPGVNGYGTDAQIRGSSKNQIMYRIDGINVQDSSGKSASLYSPLPDSIEDVQVVLSALNARNGSVQGGQMNMVTKSGSNTFEGSIRANLSRNSWGSDRKAQSAADIDAQKNENYNRTLDITVAGPIWKDRVWFYLGTRLTPSSSNLTYLAATYHAQSNKSTNPRWANSAVAWENLYGADAYTIGGDSFAGKGSNGATYLTGLKRGIIAPMATYGMNPSVDTVIYTGPAYDNNLPGGINLNSPYAQNYGMNGVLQDSGKTVASSNKQTHLEGKITGAVTDSHSLSLTFLYDKYTAGNQVGEHTSNAQQMAKAAWVGEADTKVQGLTLNWNGTFASNWTIEARVSRAKYEAEDIPNPPGNNVSLQSYWATTEPTLVLWQDANSLSDHGYVHGTSQTLNLGPIESHLSQYNKPETRGNQTIVVNMKTFQDLAGQHEIDFGFERLGTIWNFGRSKDGSRQIFTGGLYNTVDGGVAQELYPVFRRGDGAEVLTRQITGVTPMYIKDGKPVLWDANGDPNDPYNQKTLFEYATDVKIQPNEPYAHGWDASSGLRAGSAHLEKYYINGSDSENTTTSYWINDIYTINEKWNVLAGFRYNELKLDDGGSSNTSSEISEPRFQVKFNPDGKNKEVYSFSVAKLASAYSDQVSNLFRGNEWDVRTIQRWTGAHVLDQNGNVAPQAPGIETAAAATDVVTGTQGGFEYSGQNMYGVRFVDYNTVIDPENYGNTSAIFNNRVNNRAIDFKSPYAIEYNLGYQRNYATGRFSINLVNRIYKDNWVLGWRDYGTQFMVVQTSPKEGDDFSVNTGTINYSNSKNDSNYLSLELNFDKQINSRLKVGGSYTWAQQTGINDNDYYNYKSLRETLLTSAQRSVAVGEGYQAKINTAHIWMTYVHPVGKGNVSFSFRANSWQQGSTASVVGWSNYETASSTKVGFAEIKGQITDKYGPESDRCLPIDGRNGIYAGVTRTSFATYYGKMGDYKSGIDYYDTSLRIQADIPIGLGKTRLVSYFTINNLFNHAIMTNVYGMLNNTGSFSGTENWGSSGGAIGGPAGRVTASFGGAYGQAGAPGAAAYGNGGDAGARAIGDFSIGLKF